MRLPEGYVINGTHRFWHLYYLVYGIYPDWSIFVKPFKAALTVKDYLLDNVQEGCRKDTERLFSVLKGRFKLLCRDTHVWSDTEVIEIVQTCVVIHNVIISLRHGGELCDEEALLEILYILTKLFMNSITMRLKQKTK